MSQHDTGDPENPDSVPWELRGEIPHTEDDKKRRDSKSIIYTVVALLVLAGLLFSTVSGFFI